MGGKRFTPEDIIGHLRTVEIETGKGVSVQDACRLNGEGQCGESLNTLTSEDVWLGKGQPVLGHRCQKRNNPYNLETIVHGKKDRLTSMHRARTTP